MRITIALVYVESATGTGGDFEDIFFAFEATFIARDLHSVSVVFIWLVMQVLVNY